MKFLWQRHDRLTEKLKTRHKYSELSFVRQKQLSMDTNKISSIYKLFEKFEGCDSIISFTNILHLTATCIYDSTCKFARCKLEFSILIFQFTKDKFPETPMQYYPPRSCIRFCRAFDDFLDVSKRICILPSYF